jgi:hypothetical protein
MKRALGGYRTMPVGTFELKALYAGLDAKRQAGGLTWAQVQREISAVRRRPTATSTIMRLRTGTVAEGDGVLQMLRWLGRSPESFLPACPLALLSRSALPDADREEIIRFDTCKLYEALNTQRKTRALTWAQVAFQTGVPASHARGLVRGGRTAFPGVVRLTLWLDEPVARFVTKSPY